MFACTILPGSPFVNCLHVLPPSADLKMPPLSPLKMPFSHGPSRESHSQVRDLLTVAQSQMGPRLAGIDRFVNSIADRKVRPMQSFTAAGVNDIRICRRNRNRADRRRRLIVKDWLPRSAVVGGLKNAAVHRRHVEDIRLRRNTRDRASAPAAMRSDVPPAQNGIEISDRKSTRLNSSH